MFYDQRNFGRKRFRADKRHTGKKHLNANNRWTTADGAFRCAHCGLMVLPDPAMGTAHRNHCPYCLHSLHVDTRPGNRACLCHARMAPVGLTFKRNGFDKYGREKRGDLMLVHLCAGCGAVNINRIAADDQCAELIAVFVRSMSLDGDTRDAVATAGVRLLRPDDEPRLQEALFGRKVPAKR